MTFRFNEFELDPDRIELRQQGVVVPMEPKNFELLEYLIRNRDRVQSKDEIFDQIWPGVFVTEASLSGAIKNVRKALGDDGVTQKFVKTVRGHGFRFIADLDSVAPAEPTENTAMTEEHHRHGPPVIAVLPFSSHGIDRQHSAIAEGIPAELIAALSRVGSMRVLARGSTFQLKTGVHDFHDIRLRLRAQYVLSGSVSQSGRQISVVVELVDTATEHVIWSEDFRNEADDLHSIKQSIVGSVVNALEHRIPHNEASSLLPISSENLDAWGNYHLGVRHLYRFNAPDNAIAANYFEKAISQEPNFARAVAGLSYTELENYNLGYGSEKANHLRKTKDFAELAVDLDPFDPFCNLVLARAHWAYSDLDGAISWANRAVELNPNYAFALYNLGKFNAIDCASDDAHNSLQNAMALSPLDPHMQSMLSARALAAFANDDAARATHFTGLSLRAPNPHLYVCLFAAAISAVYQDGRNLDRAISQIAALGGVFDRDHFVSLFTLSEEPRARDLMSAIDALAL